MGIDRIWKILLTNAIKFTRLESKHDISVSLDGQHRKAKAIMDVIDKLLACGEGVRGLRWAALLNYRYLA